MNSRSLAIGALLLLWTMGACTNTSDIRVSSFYGKGMKFEGLGSTYNWVRSVTNETQISEGRDDMLRRIIEQHMAKRGFEVQPGESADFYLSERISVKDQSDFSVNPHGEMFEKGSLFLDVIDPETKQLVWRGVASAKLDETLTPDVREKRLDAALARLMQKFPARAGSPRAP